MRNLAMAVMILVGLSNIDHIYYHDTMLHPLYAQLWRHVLGLLTA